MDLQGEVPVGRGRRRASSLSTTVGLAAAGAASLVSVALRRAVPLTTGGAIVDDLLYVRIAGFLAHGRWLGPFDQYTLLKGPAYPAFIAAMYRSGVPLKVGEQVTYLFASAAIAACVWVVTRRIVIASVAYVVLALDPVGLATYGSRVTRDGWYSSLSMLLVATVFLAAYAAVTRVRLAWLVGVSLLAGASGAAFWLCREEPLWIAPTLLVAAGGVPVVRLTRWWFARPRAPLPRGRVLRVGGRLALATAIVGVVLIAPIVEVANLNAEHYGVPLTNDLVYGRFARAYADWRRVAGGASSASDPITRAQREAVYEVSPAARKLQPFLDPAGSCVNLCGQPVWRGLRDAAADIGAFRTEADVQSFFSELDAQIQAGCASDHLRCTVRLPAQLQSLQAFSPVPFLDYLRHWGGRLVTSAGFYEPPRELGWPWHTASKREAFTEVVLGIPGTLPAAEAQASQYAAHDWPARLLSGIYRLLLPCLLVTALIGMLTPLVQRSWPRSALWVLSSALVTGALSRLVFVALLNDTQFLTEGIDVRYLLPAHALLLAFGVVGTAQLADAVWNVMRGHRTDQPAKRTNAGAAPTAG